MKRIGRICGCAPPFLCGCAFARGAAGSIPSGAAARKKGKRRGGVQAERFRCADGFFISGARCKNGAGGLPRRWRMGSQRGAVCGGWLLGCGQRPAAGQVRQRTPNRWGKSGRRAQKQRRLCRRKSPIVGAQSAFLSSRRSAEGFCRPSGKGENASIVFPSLRKTFPPFPAGERGGTSRLYEASGCRVRRFFVWLPLGGRLGSGADFCRCENFIKTETLYAASFGPDSRKTGGRLVGAASGGYGVSLRAGKNRARAALLPCPANRRASGFCFPL